MTGGKTRGRLEARQALGRTDAADVAAAFRVQAPSYGEPGRGHAAGPCGGRSAIVGIE
ncbi:hypothetical protein [Bifidobacterium aemilianum]|uniref:hypothetical protein n=1 Tax=Bifidobacterium aemilianum TaxID=2493120 RepID=UPI001374C254|nr:hypothetical protein [Bifidobacterium aemilianum]